MAKSKQAVLDIPFGQSLWTHVRHRDLSSNPIFVKIQTTEHWGKKETCRKCHKDGTRGEFYNQLSGRGTALVIAIGLSFLAALVLFGK